MLRRVPARYKLTVADLEKLSSGVDTMTSDEIRMTALTDALKTSRDDRVVAANFKKHYRSGNYGLLLRDYNSFIQKTNHWGYVISEMPFSTDSINLVLEALSITQQSGPLSSNKVATLFRNMEKGGRPDLPKPNTRTFEIYLKVVARHHNTASLWTATMNIVKSRRLRPTPCMFASGIQIHNIAQEDGRFVWKQAVGELSDHELTDPRLLQVAATTAESLQDSDMMMELLQYAVAGDKVDVRVVARSIKLIGSLKPTTTDDKLSTISKLDKLHRIFKSKKLNKLQINTGYCQRAMELCLSLVISFPFRKFLLETVEQIYTLIDPKQTDTYLRGLLILADVLRSNKDKQLHVFMSRYADLRGKLPQMLWEQHQNNIDWFGLCCDFSVPPDAPKRGMQKVIKKLTSEAAELKVPEVATAILGRLGLFEEGTTLAAKSATNCKDTSVLPFLSLFDSCKYHPAQRQHNVIASSMKSLGIPLPAHCYNQCIRFSCEADDLDSALQWYEMLKKYTHTERASVEVYSLLLRTACAVGDGVVALSLMDQITNNGRTVPTEIIKECSETLAKADWRGDVISKFKAKLTKHEEQLLEAKKYTLLSSIAKAA